MKTTKGYWFSRDDGTTENLKTPAEVGKTDSVEGEIIPCENGLHASPTPWDALRYVSGNILWEVELTEAVPHGYPVDKFAGRTRKYLRRVDLTAAVRQFAAKQALSVIHLWDAPDIVKEFLEDTAKGVEREDIRDAAWDAAWAAAREMFNKMAMEELGE